MINPRGPHTCLAHWGRDKMAANFLTTLSNAFPWMKMHSSILVQIMAWRRPGDNPLSEPMMASLLTHICVTRPLWINMMALCNVISQPATPLLSLFQSGFDVECLITTCLDTMNKGSWITLTKYMYVIILFVTSWRHTAHWKPSLERKIICGIPRSENRHFSPLKPVSYSSFIHCTWSIYQTNHSWKPEVLLR